MPTLTIRVTNIPAYPGLGLAIQKRKDPEGWRLVKPGDEAVFEVSFELKEGSPRSPYVQNGIGGRFVYLVWTEGAAKTQFRRAKLMLDELDLSADFTFEVNATAKDGCPVCARVFSGRDQG